MAEKRAAELAAEVEAVQRAAAVAEKRAAEVATEVAAAVAVHCTWRETRGPVQQEAAAAMRARGLKLHLRRVLMECPLIRRKLFECCASCRDAGIGKLKMLPVCSDGWLPRLLMWTHPTSAFLGQSTTHCLNLLFVWYVTRTLPRCNDAAHGCASMR